LIHPLIMITYTCMLVLGLSPELIIPVRLSYCISLQEIVCNHLCNNILTWRYCGVLRKDAEPPVPWECSQPAERGACKQKINIDWVPVLWSRKHFFRAPRSSNPNSAPAPALALYNFINTLKITFLDLGSRIKVVTINKNFFSYSNHDFFYKISPSLW
jgi:hypothetical protein